MTDLEAIRLAKTAFREGYNRGDAHAVLSVFGEAFSDMSEGCPSFYGNEARAVMQHRLHKLFRKYRARMTVTIFSIVIEGPLAIDRGQHRLALTPRKGGRTRVLGTRYLEIWQKDVDGQWKIVTFIDNLDLPPQMPPREVLRAMRTGTRRLSRRSARGTMGRNVRAA